MKRFTRAEVAGRCRADNAAIVIDNCVYDVAQFLHEHPGGPEVLLHNAGKDASKCFHDIGHSDAALEWRATFKIGEVVEEDKWEEICRRSREEVVAEQFAGEWTLQSLVDACMPPLLLAALAVALYWSLLM